MPVNTLFKKLTTQQEREECFQWFEQHMDALPQQLKVDCMKIPNVQSTVKRMITVLRKRMDNSGSYEGSFATLRFIQQAVRESPDFNE